jgi:hypothetical protein
LILIKGTAGLARVSPATTISLPVYRVDRDGGSINLAVLE